MSHNAELEWIHHKQHYLAMHQIEIIFLRHYFKFAVCYTQVNGLIFPSLIRIIGFVYNQCFTLLNSCLNMCLPLPTRQNAAEADRESKASAPQDHTLS